MPDFIINILNEKAKLGKRSVLNDRIFTFGDVTVGDNKNYPEAQKNDPDTQTLTRRGDCTPRGDFPRYPNLG